MHRQRCQLLIGYDKYDNFNDWWLNIKSKAARIILHKFYGYFSSLNGISGLQTALIDRKTVTKLRKDWSWKDKDRSSSIFIDTNLASRNDKDNYKIVQ